MSQSPLPQNLSPQALAEQSSAALHKRDACAQTLNITIDVIAPGYSEVSMTINASYANGYGVCQGGIITTLADTAFAHACNSYNRQTVGSSLSIDFLRPAMVGETLSAIAKQQHRGKTTGLYSVSVYNSKNKLVAVMNGRSHEIGGAVCDAPNSKRSVDTTSNQSD